MPVNKKKQSIFSKINFKSPKSRGIVILVAFALIGGGFMVYQSFAAVNSWYYPATTLSSATFDSRCRSKIISDTNTSAKNSAVTSAVQLACDTDATKDSAVATWTKEILGSRDPNITANFYRACANVKGIGRFKVSIHTKPYEGLHSYPGIGEYYDGDPNVYTRRCSQYRQALGPQSGIVVEANVSTTAAGATINVLDIAIEKEINTAGPAPAPAK